MTFVDTNIVLRWLLEDHAELTAQANQLIAQAEEDEEQLLISDVVLSEIFYVLRFKGFEHSQVAEYLRGLLEQEAFIFEQESRLDLLFNIIGETKLDFADCYLISRAVHAQQSLKTFDKAMLKAYEKYRLSG